jgi:thiamine pyrophosphokinase
MTILTKAEQATILIYYEWGWSHQEIVSELLALRAENLKWDMQREVVSIIAHRFSSNVKCTALKDIVEKRLARGDVIEDGRISRRRY